MYAAEPMFQEDGKLMDGSVSNFLESDVFSATGLGCGTIFEVLVAGSPSASDGSDAEASEREEVDGCT